MPKRSGAEPDEARRTAQKMRVPELRAALQALDEDTSGLKAALIDRLVSAQAAQLQALPPALAAPPPPPPPEERRLRPWVQHAPHDRIARALSQRLYLIESSAVGANAKKYAVLGSTGNVYQVRVGPLVSCDCPDAAKGNVCKHQLFVFLRVLRCAKTSALIYQRALLTSELTEIFSRRTAADAKALASSSVQSAYAVASGKAPEAASSSAAPRSDADDCPICFEALGSEKLEVCSTCRNGIHAECFSHWSRSKGGGTVPCPLCRTPWPTQAAGGKARVGAEGYTNLAAEAGVSEYRASFHSWNRGGWHRY